MKLSDIWNYLKENGINDEHVFAVAKIGDKILLVASTNFNAGVCDCCANHDAKEVEVLGIVDPFKEELVWPNNDVAAFKRLEKLLGEFKGQLQ